MFKKLSLALAITSLLFITACSEETGDSVKIYKAWARETPNSSTPAGVFLTIENHSSQDIVLTGFSSPLSPRLELHAIETTDGIHSMNAKATLTIPAESTFNFETEDYHFMLWDMSKAIKAGDTFKMTLFFEGMDKIEVNVMTTGPEGMSEDHSGH